jgi:hypothetical protein
MLFCLVAKAVTTDVRGPERLIQQQHMGVEGECAREPNALLHAHH